MFIVKWRLGIFRDTFIPLLLRQYSGFEKAITDVDESGIYKLNLSIESKAFCIYADYYYGDRRGRQTVQ